VIFQALIFAWENAKRKIREGDAQFASYAQAMVLTRRQTRRYYRFMAEDMGIDFDMMEKTPFYRISLLDPKALDELCRVKKVMHPDNISAIKSILFDEILSDRSMEDILMTPQSAPYYMWADSNKHPEFDTEFAALAEELNKDLKYFQRNRRPGGNGSTDDMIDRTNGLMKKFAASASGSGGSNGIGGSDAGAGAGGFGGSAGGAGVGDTLKSLGSAGKNLKGTIPAKTIAKETAKDAAKEAARDVGRSLLRGMFRK
jgi:uncharacterized membrane protein YgcG